MSNTNQKRNAIHACGRVNGADGAALVAGTGNWTAANAGAGLSDVSFDAGSLIDPLERIVLATPKTTSLSANVPTASDTDTVFRVSTEDDASTLTDTPYDFLVLRLAF